MHEQASGLRKAAQPIQTPSSASMQLKFLTVPEVAGILRCTPDHVYRLIRRGDLRGRKNGRSVIVLESDIWEYADKAIVK